MSWVTLLENVAALGAAVSKLATTIRDAVFAKKLEAGVAQSESTGNTKSLEEAFDQRPR